MEGKKRFRICRVDKAECAECGFCTRAVDCPDTKNCVGCMACYFACPFGARKIFHDTRSRGQISIEVDGREYKVPERVTIKKALEICGFTFGYTRDEGDITAPCSTGGCYSCAISVDGKATRPCVSGVKEGMKILTRPPKGYVPLRIVHGPQPHMVGGKGTPWWIKMGEDYIEVAMWTAGCNMRCPQCQNYTTTYDSKTPPMTPFEAARGMTEARRYYGVDRMAISGGEPTLNRPWLVEFLKELKRINPDRDARLHLDSNGTVLTRDYLDELILASGVTDIGIEPKAVRVSTFMRITGLSDKKLAARFLKTSWDAVDYVATRYKEKVFLGVGLPYNSALIGLDEVRQFGSKLAKIDRDAQLCVLDYFPAFRRQDLERPHPEEMLKVKRLLEKTGLTTVVVQTSIGHFGPDKNGPKKVF